MHTYICIHTYVYDSTSSYLFRWSQSIVESKVTQGNHNNPVATHSILLWNNLQCWTWWIQHVFLNVYSIICYKLLYYRIKKKPKNRFLQHVLQALKYMLHCLLKIIKFTSHTNILYAPKRFSPLQLICLLGKTFLSSTLRNARRGYKHNNNIHFWLISQSQATWAWAHREGQETDGEDSLRGRSENWFIHLAG